MKEIFIELQRAAGLSNLACSIYLGISEGAVKDRRIGRYQPIHSELIALAVKGSHTEQKAQETIEALKLRFKA